MFGLKDWVHDPRDKASADQQTDSAASSFSSDYANSDPTTGSYLNLIDQANTIVARYDREHRYLFVNPIIERITGITYHQFLGRTNRQLGMPDALCDLWERGINDAFAQRQVPPVRFAFSSPTLGLRHCECYFMPEITADSQVQAVTSIMFDVTELRHQEAALRASEAQFRSTFEQAAVGMAHVGLNGQWLRVNQALSDILGYSTGELSGMTFQQITYPDDLNADLWLAQQLLAGKIPLLGMEKRYIRKNGTIVWVSLTVSLVRTIAGKPDYFVAVVKDISERKEAEEALRLSEERRQLLVQATLDGIWDWNPATKEYYWSDRLTGMLGYARGEISASIENFNKLMHPDDIAPTWATVERYLQHHVANYQVEFRLRHKDGQYRWILSRGLATFDEQGRPLHIVGAHTDITERKQAEEALRQSEQRLRDALVIGRAMMFDWNVETDVVERSENAGMFLGCGPEAARSTGAEFFAMVHPDDRQRFTALIASMNPRDCHRYSIEYRVIRSDGSITWLQEEARGTFDESGRLLRLSGLTADVTQRKLTEEALRQAKRDAEQANRAKDQFLATLSHELRTPLSPVLLSAASLERDVSLPPQVRDELAMMRRNIELESRLINDMLDLSRVLNGKLQMNEAPASLHSIINLAVATCKPEMDAHNLQLHLQLAASSDSVLADAARLQQVFLNLLNNAIKFTSVGGHISITSEVTPDQKIRVCVADNGIGISPNALARIFNVFEQAERDITRRFGGLGLGLAICKGIVEHHAGRISAASDGEGMGARFTVELPLLAVSSAAAIRPPDASVAVTAPTVRGGKPLQLLLVEDHVDTARTLARLLRADGYNVRTAHNVAEALELASSQSFDLIISDVGLPDASGYDLMRQIRERFGLTGIAMTGYGMQEDIEKSRDAGFSAHLVKPINVDCLEESIQRVVAQRGESV